MPIGPPGWTRRMCQEHKCEFVSMAQALASAEAGFVAWIGPKLLRCIEGSASFHPHLLLLLLGGDLGGGGLGKGRLGGCLPLAGGGVGNGRRLGAWGGELGEGLWCGSDTFQGTRPSVSDSSRSSATASRTHYVLAV